MKLTSTLFACVFGLSSAFAQVNLELHLNHKLGSEAFAFGQLTTNNLGQEFSFSRVEYYMSGFEIVHDGGQITAFPDTYLLVNASDDGVYSLGQADITSIEGIRFHIGVEAPANNADPAAWPSDHPLYYQNPSMHWGWSSGYRFAALEGDAGASQDVGFELHGLWNDNYFEQDHAVQGIDMGNGVMAIEMDADYAAAMYDIEVANGPLQHGTNQDDRDMLQNFRFFVFSPAGGSVGITNENADALPFVVYPNPSEGEFVISESEFAVTHIRVSDLAGRVILDQPIGDDRKVDVASSGVYLLQCRNAETGLVSAPVRIVVR